MPDFVLDNLADHPVAAILLLAGALAIVLVVAVPLFLLWFRRRPPR